MKKLVFPVVLLIAPCGLYAQTKTPCTTCNLGTFESILSFMPVIVFLLLAIIIFWKLNKEEYKIGDALKENTTINVSEDNPALPEPPQQASTGSQQAPAAAVVPVPAVDPFVQKTIQPKSMSRLVAFISGFVSVGLASCLCSFWMYNYLIGDHQIDLSQITNVLLALGIGVVPYAVNKIATSK